VVKAVLCGGHFCAAKGLFSVTKKRSNREVTKILRVLCIIRVRFFAAREEKQILRFALQKDDA
jgi:hypothetical protein